MNFHVYLFLLFILLAIHTNKILGPKNAFLKLLELLPHFSKIFYLSVASEQ